MAVMPEQDKTAILLFPIFLLGKQRGGDNGQKGRKETERKIKEKSE